MHYCLFVQNSTHDDEAHRNMGTAYSTCHPLPPSFESTTDSPTTPQLFSGENSEDPFHIPLQHLSDRLIDVPSLIPVDVHDSPHRRYLSDNMVSEPVPIHPALLSSPTEGACHSTIAQRRRPVVTMGPRADCEKCRMRVPGHWMHFD